VRTPWFASSAGKKGTGLSFTLRWKSCGQRALQALRCRGKWRRLAGERRPYVFSLSFGLTRFWFSVMKVRALIWPLPLLKPPHLGRIVPSNVSFRLRAAANGEPPRPKPGR